MTKLKISDTLALPLDSVTQTFGEPAILYAKHECPSGDLVEIIKEENLSEEEKVVATESNLGSLDSQGY